MSKEEEPKTLKDFETKEAIPTVDGGYVMKTKDCHTVSKEELKQEAIKDIKELRKGPSMRANEINKILGTYAEEPVIEYIKWKFNIKEEDLKGGK